MSQAHMLKEIVRRKQERISFAKQQISEEDLKIKAKDLPSARPFLQAISKPKGISLIAEIKKASPSRGIIRQDFNLQQIAKIYEEAGAQAISILTEEDYFAGSLSYINEVKGLVKIPILRKDFILEAYQVYESRYYGADAILLIASLLTKEKLSELMHLAETLGLGCLIEVHTEKDLKKALNFPGSGIPLMREKALAIGINNRDLETLEVDFKTTEKLFPLIPKDKVVVVESGIKNYQDVLFLKILGASAVLIGEAFMEAQDIGKKVQELMGW